MGSMSCKERPSTATAGDETDEYIEAAVAETSELENGQYALNFTFVFDTIII